MPPRRRSNIGRRTRNNARRARHRVEQQNEAIVEPLNRAVANSGGLNNVNARRQRQVNLLNAAFNYDCSVDYKSHQLVQIGTMCIVCTHCNAYKFKNEAPGLCCMNGKVKLQELAVPPEPLRYLVSGTTPESKHFLDKIQTYNSCFQMTSFGATYIVRDIFMPTFKVLKDDKVLANRMVFTSLHKIKF